MFFWCTQDQDEKQRMGEKSGSPGKREHRTLIIFKELSHQATEYENKLQELRREARIFV